MRSILDALMFALAASVTLSQKLSMLEIAILVVIVAGTTLWGTE